jgi:hypothetical protein
MKVISEARRVHSTLLLLLISAVSGLSTLYAKYFLSIKVVCFSEKGLKLN